MAPMDIRRIPLQLREFWQGLSAKQKAILIGGVLGTAILLTTLLWFIGRPSYGLLYRGLDEAAAGQVVQYLREQKIPYRVEKDGSIYVLEEKVPEVRMEIASRGFIGAGGPGFELFDKEKLGLTEFQEKVNYQRALEGELARTIAGIKGVKSVRVHLAMPKESLFIEEEKPPKASVLIELKPGHSLTPAQVKGIVNLVSGAVPKLEPANITVVDASTGKNLYTPETQEELLSVTQLAYKKRVEENLKNKVEEILTTALGYGKAQAQVTVELSFDKESLVEESVDPEGSAVVSEDLEDENRQSRGPQEEGVPGVKGALTQKFEGTSPTSPGETYSKKRIVRNYEVSKKVRNLEVAPGSLKKLSVAVVVDKKVLAENDTAKIEWIENLVKGAVGYNPDRGDEVKIEIKPFVEPPEKKPGIMEYLAQFYKPLAIVILLVLLYFLVIRPIIKALRPAPARVPEAPPVPEERILAPEAEEEILPREIAIGIIRSQPERAAALVKKWLLEETLEERKRVLAEAK
ncbi:MAG: flagellar basal-body MS-ring/collar protein FliF [Caldimicrobium sp.]|nr:flagellar basal-body MS-ring/collar protein FliF [Caldimicrobium sp.]MCX7612628.1 flagellar basal-body MS-ring/collar protein FliF [Caldimicrobium sp.]MDW8182219.1 flagellar basal-body MS-ring/collar protein FliF [Caldimicrobium sp.]